LSTPPCIEEWVKEIQQQRQHYNNLKQKYLNHTIETEDDPNINNPLSLDVNSSWYKYHEDKQLQHIITMDVSRVYPEYPFFQQQWVKDMMIRILFIFSKEYADISYKGGMYELLAPMIYMLDHEKMVVQKGSILSQLMDKDCIEADAYIIYERLMNTVGSFFKPIQNNYCEKCQHVYKLLKAKDPVLYSYVTLLGIEPLFFFIALGTNFVCI